VQKPDKHLLERVIAIGFAAEEYAKSDRDDVCLLRVVDQRRKQGPNFRKLKG
jgi:hypothetical protein